MSEGGALILKKALIGLALAVTMTSAFGCGPADDQQGQMGQQGQFGHEGQFGQQGQQGQLGQQGPMGQHQNGRFMNRGYGTDRDGLMGDMQRGRYGTERFGAQNEMYPGGPMGARQERLGPGPHGGHGGQPGGQPGHTPGAFGTDDGQGLLGGMTGDQGRGANIPFARDRHDGTLHDGGQFGPNAGVYDGDLSQSLARQINAMDGVRNCSVLVHGNEVLVAADTNGQNQDDLEEDIRSRVQNQVKGNADVHITTDNAMVDRLADIQTRLRDGEAFRSTAQEVGDLLRQFGSNVRTQNQNK